ncbi:MAG: pantoate--beta-alanine ligase [Acidimicrobiia bacterium]
MNQMGNTAGPGIEVFHHIADLRVALSRARNEGRSIGCVMTMGALHLGHASLINAAVNESDVVVVTVFVNPTQFGPHEDLAAYPRTLDADCSLAYTHGAAIVFAPSVEEMYPGGIGQRHTTIHVDTVSERLCGESRPGHFDGVSTVVTKLFGIVGPCTAYFGKKDAQQLAVIRALTRDLSLPVEIVGCPIVRESDGLALSSRNQYLTGPERQAAPGIALALFGAADRIEAGECEAASIVASVTSDLAEIPGTRIDYVELVDAETFQRIERVEADAVLAVAVFFGGARLIDNVHIAVAGDDITIDRGRSLPTEEP